jgi:hypothetical protein
MVASWWLRPPTTSCVTPPAVLGAFRWRRRNTCGWNHHPGKVLPQRASSEHFHDQMFHAFDFDATMLRIGSMNLMLHGIEQPDVELARDSLSEDHTGMEGSYYDDPGQSAL